MVFFFLVICLVESENILINFFYYVTLQFVHLHYTLKETFTHAWVCNMCWLVEKILVYWLIQIIQMLTYFITQYQNFLFVNISRHPIRKVFKAWKTVRHMVINERHPKYDVCLKTQILQFQQIPLVVCVFLL